MSARIYTWIPIFCYSALIFLLSSRSLQGVPHDKWIHLLEYSAFGLLLAWPFSKVFDWKGFPLVLAVFAAGCLFGLSDEVHQYFVPGRMASVGDWLADAVGSFLGGLLYVACDRTRRETPATR